MYTCISVYRCMHIHIPNPTERSRGCKVDLAEPAGSPHGARALRAGPLRAVPGFGSSVVFVL